MLPCSSYSTRCLFMPDDNKLALPFLFKLIFVSVDATVWLLKQTSGNILITTLGYPRHLLSDIQWAALKNRALWKCCPDFISLIAGFHVLQWLIFVTEWESKVILTIFFSINYVHYLIKNYIQGHCCRFSSVFHNISLFQSKINLIWNFLSQTVEFEFLD